MPIIVVSARCEDTDKIEALDAGADDYLTKPFSVGELLARVRVTLRRLEHLSDDDQAAASTFVNGDLRIDYAAGVAFIGEDELHLTPIEYKLLCLLSRNVDKVLTHQYILRQVWGESQENDLASLRVFMKLARGDNEIIQFEVSSDSQVVGHSVKDLKLPEKSILVAIERPDGKVLIPNGNTVINEGDEIIALTDSEGRASVKRTFA